MVRHTYIIILEELKLSHLAKIKLFMGEHIMKALTVSKHIYVYTVQVMSPNIYGKYHCFKLEYMS